MDQQADDLIKWTNYFKGNYRKGVRRLRAILDEPTLYEKLKADVSAMNSVVTCYDRNSSAMQAEVYDTGLGDDLAVSYAAAAGYGDLEGLLNNAPGIVLANIMGMSDALLEAVLSSAVAFGKVIASRSGIRAAFASDTISDAVLASNSALDAILASEKAIAIAVDDENAIEKLSRSTTFMEGAASSTSAMESIADSKTAMLAMANSAIALNAISKVSAARTAWMESDYAHSYYAEVYQTLHNAPDDLFLKYEDEYSTDASTTSYACFYASLNTGYTTADGGMASSNTSAANHSGAVAFAGITLMPLCGYAKQNGTAGDYGSSQTKETLVVAKTTSLQEAYKVCMGGLSYYNVDYAYRSYDSKFTYATYTAV